MYLTYRNRHSVFGSKSAQAILLSPFYICRPLIDENVCILCSEAIYISKLLFCCVYGGVGIYLVFKWYLYVIVIMFIVHVCYSQ